jgi:hypothetical protein
VATVSRDVRERRVVRFSSSSNERIKRNSRGGGDDRGIRWPQCCPRGVAWRKL